MSTVQEIENAISRLSPLRRCSGAMRCGITISPLPRSVDELFARLPDRLLIGAYRVIYTFGRPGTKSICSPSATGAKSTGKKPKPAAGHKNRVPKTQPR